MSLLQNLILAEQAVKYANDQLLGRSSNRSEDMVRTVVENLHESYKRLDQEDMKVLMRLELNGGGFAEKRQLLFQERYPQIEAARESRKEAGNRLNSAAIIKDNVGNWFEHSVLACSYLNSGHRRVSGQPIASYLVDTDPWTNHTFVLVGAPPGLAGRTIKVTKHEFGAINTGETVVCDPWWHEWFGVQQDWYKMWRIFASTKKQKTMTETVPLTFTDGAQVT
jgi:hypothetical protein